MPITRAAWPAGSLGPLSLPLYRSWNTSRFRHLVIEIGDNRLSRFWFWPPPRLHRNVEPHHGFHYSTRSRTSFPRNPGPARPCPALPSLAITIIILSPGQAFTWIHRLCGKHHFLLSAGGLPACNTVFTLNPLSLSLSAAMAPKTSVVWLLSCSYSVRPSGRSRGDIWAQWVDI